MSNDKDNPIDPTLSDLYESTKSGGPSADLDAAILAQAEAAVTSKPKRPAWIAPVGLAATVVLGVNLAVSFKDYSTAPNVYSENVVVPVIADNADGIDNTVVTEPSDQQKSTPTKKTALADSERTDFTSNAPDPMAMPVPSAPLQIDQPTLETSDRLSSENEALSESSTIDVDGLLEEVRNGQTRDVASRSHGPQPSGQLSDSTPTAVQTDSYFADSHTDLARKEVESKPTSQQQSARLTLRPSPAKPAQRDVRIESQEAIAQQRDNLATEGPVESASFGLGNSSSDSTGESDSPSRVTNLSSEPSPELAAASSPPQVSTPPIILDQATDQITLEELVVATETESESEEIVVTGSRVPRSDDSPHRRLTAKEGASRNSVSTSDSMSTSDRSQPVEATAQEEVSVYQCDLNALAIDAEVIENAKVEARSMTPPLNAVTWPGHIENLYGSREFINACAHLAAFRQLYPDLVLFKPLPLELPDLK